jgi:CheY-like chemotaxis protein
MTGESPRVVLSDGCLPTTRAKGATEVTEGRPTILVVDDEEMVRRLAARMLLLMGYRVLEARDGQEALQLLQRPIQQVTVVLTDLAMPGIGGRRLGETITECWPCVRVLYMSGFPGRRMVDEGALDPGQPFIQKPFTSEQLGKKVREVLARVVDQ